eukprot:1118161-Prymnesium_polylepis.1
MRETAVSRWGVSRETARDSRARQRETARRRETAARQPRILLNFSYVNLCNKLVAYRSGQGTALASTAARRPRWPSA